MKNQRLRNLTTYRLHTKMEHIYKDLEKISGVEALYTHSLPAMAEAVEPWLREKVTDPRFWDGKYDPEHTGKTKLPEPTEGERELILKRFRKV